MNPLSIFTTAEPVGVATRDLVVVAGAVLAVLGALGLLDEEQVKALTEAAPGLFLAIGSLATIGTSVYRTLMKSSSDKATEIAKEVDAKIPPSMPVEIKTPGDQPDIKVAGVK